MKCIHCGTNANYRTRQPSGRCPECQHQYAFEPKTQPHRMTDFLFQKAIDRVSYKGELYFTERQLWHELNRGLARRGRLAKMIWPTFGASVITVFLFSRLGSPLIFIIPFVAFGVTIAWNYYSKHYARLRPRMPFDQFIGFFLPRWLKAHGKPHKLLTDKEIRIKPRRKEVDLTDYGFERLVITENGETAAMLLANNLHLEKKCAILCAKDLSSNQAKVILKMIESNTQLMVMIVHNATIEGCGLSSQIRQEPWFRENDFQLIDLGLTPDQAKKLRLFTLEEPVPDPIAESFQADHFSAAEVNWLKQGYSADLEGLRPRHLLHSIAHGFAFADKNNLVEEEAYDEGIYWFETFG